MFANSLEALQADLQLHKFVAKMFWLGDVKIELAFDAAPVRNVKAKSAHAPQ